MTYFDEIKRSMEMLAEHPQVMFLGQAVGCPGTAMSNTLKDINKCKLIELPVFEETQLGMSIGMSLAGLIPVSIFPRFNFLLLACNQLVNHLDKLEQMSHGDYKPGVIIRVGVGSEDPLWPSWQHVSNMSHAFRSLLTNIPVYELHRVSDIVGVYDLALRRAEDGQSTIVVEWSDFYNHEV